MKKSKDGQYTDGFGNSYVVGKDESKVINYNGYKFQYSYKNRLLVMSDNKVMYKMGLSVGDWLDNPIYWVQNMYRKYQ
jgi:lipopolysaccharide export system protein LptA